MWTRRTVLAAGAALAAGALLPRSSLAATGQLRIALQAEPPHLDPTAEFSAATMQASFQNIFESLTRIDEHGGVLPGLAKSWMLSPDGLTYTFALQGEVRYHDGTAFDAQHVIFSLNRLLDPNSGNPQRAMFGGIAGATAPDDTTVKIVLKQKDDAFLFNLGRAEASIVAPESADNNRNVPIGTGPFVLTQWDHGQRILFDRNEDYWGVHPLISEATLTFVADPGAGIAALLGNEIDGYPVVPAADALAPLKANTAVKIVSGTGPDKQPRTGAWNSQLSGMWVDAPVEAVPLAGIKWAGDTSPAQVGPAPFITNSD